MELSERRKKILGLVVREYISSAQPVGSEALARLRLGVSSATIRNELAALEAEGFLTHPHTSAGRIPTEQGYRYFVASLMEELELSPAEQRMILHQFHQVTLDVDQWMRLSAAVLAHTSHTAALVSPPRGKQARFKHLELIAISDGVAMLVLVLQEGTVKQQMLTLPSPIEQDELRYMANRLNDNLAGNTAGQVRARTADQEGFMSTVVGNVAGLMDQMDRLASRELYRDGLIDILKQPEFAVVDRMQQLLQVLEERNLLEEIMLNLAPSEGVQIVIGREGGHAELNEYSMVLARYGIEGEASGVIGVFGPLRMPYPRAVSAVRYVSTLLDDLMQRFYGGK
ncbi:MAG: heat-inducible transcriptional repressor HrcA [Anaerolineae bacterium]